MAGYKGFTQVELRKPKRSMFNLSHESRVSSRIGRLTPIYIEETIPNDTFSVSSEIYVKLAPMITPIFHRLNMYVHFFFVPWRLLWEDWEDFITGGRLGDDVTTPPVPPNVKISDVIFPGGAPPAPPYDGLLDTGSLFDYLGGPSIVDASGPYAAGQTIDIGPFAAWAKVYMDYYRDRNYTADSLMMEAPLTSGNHAFNGAVREMFLHRQRAYQHDYFTSAQQDTQRGLEVLMPLEGSGNMIVNSLTDTPIAVSKDIGTGPALSTPGQMYAHDTSGATNYEEAKFLLDESSVSINEFRRAISLQQWLERNQLAGSRYNESIYAHFARKTSDGRLQRAEYLGGGKAVIKIDEVMTTSYSEDASSDVVPPANPTGKGAGYSNTNRFHYNCEEHGFIIGILSVLPTTAYMQGMPKMFVGRRSFFDYPWPTFANLGEQPVYDYEVWADEGTLPDGSSEPSVFGYQSRYAEWKDHMSTAHGDFRTDLDMWHLVRKFAGPPNLGQEFVEFGDAEQDRIFNVSGVDTLWMYIYNDVKVVRSLPYFGVPAGLSPNAL